jgi:hypothetical protein
MRGKAMKALQSVLFLAVVSACAHVDSSSFDATPLTVVASDDAGPLTMQVLEQSAPHTGLNALFFRPSDASQNGQTLTVVATANDSETGVIGAPILAPATLNSEGFFEIDMVFAPSSLANTEWSLTWTFAADSSSAITGTIPLDVADDGAAARFDANNTHYIASMTFLQSPTIGVNPIVVTLHGSSDTLTFLPVSDATVAIDPEMPDMGHGSTGSTPPTATSLGQYAGTVSFTMPGTWVTKLTFSQNGTPLGAASFTTHL